MKRLLDLAFDWYLVILTILLIITGLVTIYSLTLGAVDIGLFYGQLRIAIFGFILGFSLGLVQQRRFMNASMLLYLAGLGLLILVPIFGTETFGAKRWIALGSFQLQPSEPIKLFLILFLARFFHLRKIFRPFDFVTLLIIVGLPVVLILTQPDLGTAIVLLGIAVTMMIAANLSLRYWLAIGVMALFSLPIAYLNLQTYQIERIKTFLSPTSDPFGAGYNVIQSLIAVGNGGIFGQGFGQGTQSQLNFLPVAHTDFIFAGVAEATGLVGTVILLLVFGGIISRSLMIGRKSPDDFGYFVAIGIAAMWFIQLIVNVGMNLGLAPVTGITLPFVSHGGSSLITNLVSVGILLSIGRQSHLLVKSKKS